jgi:hypothetical protein
MVSVDSGTNGPHQAPVPYIGQSTPPSLNTSITPPDENPRYSKTTNESNPHQASSFEIHISADSRGVLYVTEPPNKGSGTSVEQKLVTLVASHGDSKPHKVTFKASQRVLITFVGNRDSLPQSLVSLEGTPLSQVELQVEGQRVILRGATNLSGKDLFPDTSKMQAAPQEITPQLSQEQQKWLTRRARILELQHEPALIITAHELHSIKSLGTYPASVVRHLEYLEESFKILFQHELKNDSAKSAKAHRPSWAAEFRKLAISLKEHLDTPSPYLDALLTVRDPKNGKYRSMAHSRQLQTFLQDCSSLGMMPNFTEAGRAKIVVKPVIDKLLRLTGTR